ncbi:MAG: SCO family protein [Planctomycetes bacterium]|nr:SCO family protein [Planctomycetota bacterium]MCB9916769.1 SCO family protein [Planctomycetota bacterium]
MASEPSLKRFLLLAGFVLAIAGVATFAAWQYYSKRVPGQRQATSESLPILGDVPAFALTSFDGTQVTRESLAGKVWVADFIFTTCGGLCPIMTNAMAGVQDAARKAGLGPDDLRLVSVSTDPETDTPERLRAYAEQHRARTEQWHFLRGPFDQVQSFSQDALKLALERASEKQRAEGAEKIMHSDRFVLVDRESRIRGFYSGTRPSEVRQLIEDLPRLVAEGPAKAGASK